MDDMERAIRLFLEEENVEIVRETSKGEFNCRCPLPDHSDRKASFSINRETGLWNCFGCRQSGSFTFLYARVNEIDMWRALNEIRGKYEIDLTLSTLRADLPDWEDLYGHPLEKNRRLEAEFRLYHEERVPLYYKDRGFSVADWMFWGGGVDHRKSLIVFPVNLPDGGIVGIVGRSQYSTGFRYMNYEGSDPKSTLYGIDKIFGRKELLVTEGLFDTQKCFRMLGTQVDVVGLLSTEWSDIQLNLMSQWDRITLWLDNDEEGEKAAGELTEALLNRGKQVYEVPYFADVKDQTDLPDTAIVSFFGQRINVIEKELGRLLT